MLPAAPRFAFVDLDIPWEGERVLTLACLQALDNQDLGVWVCDSQGGVEYLSQSFLEMVGMDLEECRNLGLVARLPPEDVPATLGKWRHCLEEGSPWDHVHRIRDRQGHLRHVLSRGGPLRDEEGRRLAWVGVNLDVTAMKSAETDRRERRWTGPADGMASRKLDLIGRLAGGVAHDFNNLLTAINGYSELVLSMVGDKSPVSPYVREIREAGQRAAVLTRQLLAFSRRQIMAPRMLDLNSMVQESWGKLEGFLGPDIDKRFLPCPTATRIKADPSQVEQVLLNLAINAKEAMPQGGTLLVETARVELRPEELILDPEESPARPGAYVLLRVRDSGQGMDEEGLAHLFEPFYSTKQTGHGLGLPAVYGIVKQSDGYIGVSSRPGSGTELRIYWPSGEEFETQDVPAL